MDDVTAKTLSNTPPGSGAAPAPLLVTVGHVTCDLVDRGTIPGGAAYYSSLAAQALGARVGAITAAGPSFPHLDALEGVETHVGRSAESTCFRNEYHDGNRVQTLCGLADPIARAHVPDRWQEAAGVYLCPVMGEVELEIAAQFPEAIIAIGCQGWMRRAEVGGKVRPLRWRPDPGLLERARVHFAVLSDEDARSDPHIVDHLVKHVPVVAFTHGRDGCDLYVEGERHRLPAWPTGEVDPTGAGDVFGAAMLFGLASRWEPLRAARLAACAASVAVEERGGEGLVRVAEAWRRLAAWEADDSGVTGKQRLTSTPTT
jgi:sugar/nucleoside kinase (ribokinase family)